MQGDPLRVTSHLTFRQWQLEHALTDLFRWIRLLDRCLGLGIVEIWSIPDSKAWVRSRFRGRVRDEVVKSKNQLGYQV